MLMVGVERAWIALSFVSWYLYHRTPPAQGTGMLCLFSLKNPSWPEFSCTTPTGVMCIDWHPQHSSVLCVGLYDGTVCVYDVRSKSMAPIYQSTVKTGKHTDPVWEVSWQEEDLAKNLNFFSVCRDACNPSAATHATRLPRRIPSVCRDAYHPFAATHTIRLPRCMQSVSQRAPQLVSTPTPTSGLCFAGN